MNDESDQVRTDVLSPEEIELITGFQTPSDHEGINTVGPAYYKPAKGPKHGF